MGAKRPKPATLTAREAQPQADVGSIGDSYVVEVKGPGPEWAGRDEALVEAGESITPDGLPIGHVGEDAKGPGLEWETDEAGEYVNR